MPEVDDKATGTLDTDKRDDIVDDDADASGRGDAGGSDHDAPEGESEVDRLKRINAQLLSRLTPAEKLAKENEDLKRQLAERGDRNETPAPTADSSQRELDKIRKELDDDLRAFRADAESDDPVRKRYGRQMLRNHSVVENQWREAQFQKDLREAPADLRDDVEKLIRDREAGTIKAAIRLAKADRRERDETKDASDRDSRNEDKRTRRDDAPALGGGGGSSSSRERVRPMTKQQVIDRKNQLRESGTMEERQKFNADVSSGRITIKG